MAAYAVLTVSIGATTAIFSILNSVLIAPLPIEDAGHVVRVTALDHENSPARLSLPDLLDLKRRSHSADAFAFYRDSNGNLASGKQPLLVHMLEIDSALFQVLGVKLAQGRAFSRDANQPGHACEMVLSWNLWRSHFNGEPVIGRVIRLNEMPCQVTGVLPEKLDIPVDVDVWVPKNFDLTNPANGRAFRSFYGMAHLKRGASVIAFNAELAELSARLAQENPTSDSGLRLQAVALRDVVNGNVKSSVLILCAAVIAVLLMACANVANWLLARASARLGEISVRVAVGASRIALLQQLLTESLVLAMASSLSGLALTVLFVRWFRNLPNPALPRPESIAVDWRVMLFAILAGVVTSLVFGALPAIRVSFTAITGLLNLSSGRMTESRPQQFTRKLLIAAESALATLLLIASLLLLRSFSEVSKIDPGFRTDHLLTAYVSLNPGRYRYTADSDRFARRVIQILQAKSGILSAAFTTSIPLQGVTSGSGPVQIEGREMPARPMDSELVMNTGVTPEFRRTLGIPLKAGVDLKERDDREEATAILVNAAFAKTFFPNESAVGKRIRYSPNVNPAAPWQQIAGVIGDTRQSGVEAEVRPELYVPLVRSTNMYPGIVIRTKDNPLSHLHELEAAVHEADAELPIFHARSMEQVEARGLGRRKFITTLLSAFACLALLLASGGIFAVLGNSISQRSFEIAVRMALGATQSKVLRMIAWQGLLPAFAGIAAGLAGALVLNRYLANLLYGVQPNDLLSCAGAVLLLSVASCVAALVPAFRASQVEPWKALRHQ